MAMKASTTADTLEESAFQIETWNAMPVVGGMPSLKFSPKLPVLLRKAATELRVASAERERLAEKVAELRESLPEGH